MFKIEDAPITIRPKSTLEGATTMPRGEKGSPSPVTEIKLLLEVEVEDYLKDIETVFPGIDAVCKYIAGTDVIGGLDVITRTKIGAFNVGITYRDESVFEQSNCRVMGRPKLLIDSKGIAKMMINVMVKATGKEQAALSSKINAQCSASFEPAQTDMSDTTKLATPAPMVPKRSAKGKGAASGLAVVPASA